MKKITIPIMFLLLVSLLSLSVLAYPITVRVQSNVGKFHTSVYKCNGPQCGSYTFYSHSFGSQNVYVLGGSGKQYFAEFDYKRCYPGQTWMMGVDDSTCNGPHDYNINFVKGENCKASIKSLIASDYDVMVGETVSFTAVIHSAFEYEEGKPRPTQDLIVPYYSSHVDTFFYVNGELKKTKAIDIPFGKDKSVTYTYTFTAPGTYEVSVYTKLDNDCKCENSVWSHKTVIITVTGECEPGEIEQESCGWCGYRERTCLETGEWGDWSSCMDEGVCEPGSSETQSCGFSDVGECSLGEQGRTCSNECQWDAWGECIGAVYPQPEICDNKDNDCDCSIDEDLVRDCGSNNCAGTQTCTAGSWGPCSSEGQDCGVCAACDDSSNCVYDKTQDGDCPDTICPDSCFLVPDCNPLTWDYAPDVPNECVALFQCSNYDCDYSHECSITNCGAECEQDDDCDDSNPNTLDTCNLNECVCEHECLPYCGDGSLDPGEECELPSTSNNVNCPQSQEECDGHRLGTRDAYGECDASCGCVEDAFTYSCVPGECGAVCSQGETQVEPCGDCGYRIRTCSQDCVWGLWGECLDQGVCTPGETELISCGFSDVGECEYGVQGRVCNSECQWNPFGCCIGAVYPVDEVCDGKDNDCDGLIDEGLPVACYVDCDCPEDGYYGGEYRDYYCHEPGTCFSQCLYDTYECTPGETEQESCGRCGYRQRVCLGTGEWGDWSYCMSQGVCEPGATDTESCGLCGERQKTCTENCQWSAFGECTGQGICSPGETELRSCGFSDVGECSLGEQGRVCNSECGWNSWGGCVGAVYPEPEVCDNKDNDCDGLIDDGLPIACYGDHNCPDDGYYNNEFRDYYCYEAGTCFSQCLYNVYEYECTPGEKRSCGLTDVGICAMGYQECVSGFWSSCIGDVYPQQEICDNNLDDDCDGLVDEGCYEPDIYARRILRINKLMMFNDCVVPGTDFIVLVSFENTASYDLKGIRITGVIDELNDIVRLGPFNLNHREEETKLLFFNIPRNAKEGEYTLTVIVSNDNVRRIKHRTFRVNRYCPYIKY